MRETEMFRIQPTGKEHTVGDVDCPGCEALGESSVYPRPHLNGPNIAQFKFLVHGERFGDVFRRHCEGGCHMPPIRLGARPK
jgi:hypothetical protein